MATPCATLKLPNPPNPTSNKSHSMRDGTLATTGSTISMAGATHMATYTPGITSWSGVDLTNPTLGTFRLSIVGLKVKRAPTPGILHECQSGQDIRTQKVLVGQVVANIITSSLDHVIPDKKLVDDINHRESQGDHTQRWKLNIHLSRLVQLLLGVCERGKCVIAKAIGRTVGSTFVDMKGTKTASTCSLILRGVNDYMVDETERALHDASSIIKRTLESNTGGCRWKCS
ncbi:hypothetical protein MLD38_031205 [Melastoma candidum]|uniref:Uncharacterized protein n=1 Tax=Melastoma candidum TaxID=119954 RepID=A0ACB9MQ90_9MYRT|nr:hypothetical protein MLD38_031205 [Melastoma candidum]